MGVEGGVGGGSGRCLCVLHGNISFSLETLRGLWPSTPLPQLSFPGTDAGDEEKAPGPPGRGQTVTSAAQLQRPRPTPSLNPSP